MTAGRQPRAEGARRCSARPLASQLPAGRAFCFWGFRRWVGIAARLGDFGSRGQVAPTGEADQFELLRSSLWFAKRTGMASVASAPGRGSWQRRARPEGRVAQ